MNGMGKGNHYPLAKGTLDRKAFVAKILDRRISHSPNAPKALDDREGGKLFFSSVMQAEYVAEVEKSGILTPENMGPREEKDEFSYKLATSRALARREFANCHIYMMDLFEQMNQTETSIIQDMDHIRTDRKSYIESWEKIFEQFHAELGKIFQYAQEKIIRSFEKKVRRIDHFCICLFGRTKAGKSSTMEALTTGDGKTIGIGRQNTTQHVKEYLWNGLLVVDTPGIDAMDRMRDLEGMALSYADDSDLIIFLLPHQIQEGDFEKFARFYKQNKPILILLNIKKDPGEKGSPEFRHFLKYPDEVLPPDRVEGYRKRIEDFILSRLHIAPGLIPIVPIHSKAAFMASREPDLIIQKALRKASNFDTLEEHLCREICNYAELYRIKNPYDTVALFSRNIQTRFMDFEQTLSKQAVLFRENVERFNEVKSRIVQKRDGLLKQYLVSYLTAKKRGVTGLVDRLFDERKEKIRKQLLNDFLSQTEIRGRVEKCQTEMTTMIKSQIQEFFESFSQQLSLLRIDARNSIMASDATQKLDQIQDLRDTGDLLEGLGVAVSVVAGLGLAVVAAEGAFLGTAGTLFGIGSSNLWNPVGWGLLVASAALGILGLKKKKQKQEKTIQAKKKAVADLKGEIDKIRNSSKRALWKWSDAAIAIIEEEHIDVMEQYATYADKHLEQVRGLIRSLENGRQEAAVRKFESMLGRLADGEGLAVTKVSETENRICVNVRSTGNLDFAPFATALSRVEEAQVRIVTEENS